VRIVTQLSVLLIATAALAVVLVTGAVAWNLRSGFADYLQQRDSAELQRLAQRIEQQYAQDPQLQTLRSTPNAMRDLVDALVPEHVHQQHAANLDMAPTRPPPPGLELGPAMHVLQRTSLVDTQGQRLAGPPLATAQAQLRVPVRIAGQTVAYAQTPAAAPLADVDARFLQRQYSRLAWVAVLTLCAALALAVWVARRWSLPLTQIRQAAQRIAKGDFEFVVPTTHTAEIKALGLSISSMANALQSLDAQRRQWLAQVSHELRTPLTVLRGELEAIVEGVRPATPALLKVLRDETLHLTRLAADLHTLAVAELDGVNCNFNWGDAGSWLQGQLQRFEPLAQQARLQLDIAAAPAAQVYWDFDRMAQVVDALMDNSLRYTQAPGQLQVRASCNLQTQRYTLSVSDSAPGVDDKELAQMFEPLFRTQRALQPGARHGSGLGLAVAQSWVLAHGGRIWATASNLGGLTVHLDLPWEAA
jgi:two-component system, OmpR family, sensor histidine kinase BaeS